MFAKILAIKKQFLLVCCGICYITTSWASISFSSAQQVFNTLIKRNNIQRHTSLFYSKNPEINAVSFGGRVEIYKGLLYFLKNKDELAMVLGHELAHETGTRNEAQADINGAYFMQNAGYNRCIGAKWLTRIYLPATKKYPSSKQRYKNIGC